jgi:hypothetical protein
MELPSGKDEIFLTNKSGRWLRLLVADKLFWLQVVRRIVNELQVRGYRTWFDLDNMKGSTVDAMSGKDTSNLAVACD